MNQEYIDIFVNTSIDSLRESMDIQVEKGESKELAHSTKVEGVVVIIGITGDLEGRIIYELELATALKIAEAMNYEPFEVLDDLARSTISELANIMAGRTISAINDRGIKIMISPPVLLTGKDMKTSDRMSEIHCITLESNLGVIGINLALMSLVATKH